MGVDKGTLVYAPSVLDQRSHCAALLAPHCAGVFVSCRADQVPDLAPGLRPLVDLADVGDIGPAAGLLSAHRHAPGAAWLVLAVDFPFAAPDGLGALITDRDPRALGTAFVNGSGGIEPLFAVWEPAGLETLAAAAVPSPRQVLEGGSCRRVNARDPRMLLNVNTPGDPG